MSKPASNQGLTRLRERPRLLLLEDSVVLARETVAQLGAQGLEVDWEQVDNADAFAARLDHGIDAVIANYHIPGTVVRRVLAITQDRQPETPFLVISAEISPTEGVDLMRLGARDFFRKDHLEALGAALMRSLDSAREQKKASGVERGYQRLFANLPLGVVRILADGNVVIVNLAMLEMLGFPDEATFRREAIDFAFVPAEVRADMTERLLQDGFLKGFETQALRQDGTLAWVRIDINVTKGADGAAATYEAAVIDIEDQKRAEADLRWSDDQRRLLLERAISAHEDQRQRIAQGIHDDAVQVMSAANIHLAVLGRKVSDSELGAEVDELIDAVGESTERLRDLIFELRPPALDRSGLVAALQDQMEVLWGQIDGIGFELIDHLSHEPPNGHGLLIYRIAQEAFANIRKHADASHVTVTIEDQDDGVLMRVRDDGRGFQPLDSKEPAPGHIGLASMTERASLVGGWCTVESSPGAGTTMALWVPVLDEPVLADHSLTPRDISVDDHADGRPSRHRGAGKRVDVLIVEDHPVVAQALGRLFDDFPDIKVVGIAGTASEAAHLASELRPTVVIMDSHLPGGSGAEAATRIRTSEPATAILFYSGDNSDSAISDAVNAGAAAYLSKGSRPEKLIEAVRQVAAGEMLIPAALLSRLINSKRAAALSTSETAAMKAGFTARELEVLGIMGEGLDNEAIAERLCISLNTARWHIRNILDKLHAHSKLEGVVIGARLGLLTPETPRPGKK
ncbi:MAG: response regulator [Candidatus Dormibacteria bacterium]